MMHQIFFPIQTVLQHASPAAVKTRLKLSIHKVPISAPSPQYSFYPPHISHAITNQPPPLNPSSLFRHIPHSPLLSLYSLRLLAVRQPNKKLLRLHQQAWLDHHPCRYHRIPRRRHCHHDCPIELWTKETGYERAGDVDKDSYDCS
jgi:hypothetical protein